MKPQHPPKTRPQKSKLGPKSPDVAQAVVAISRLLRIVNMLVAMLQEGLGEDPRDPKP